VTAVGLVLGLVEVASMLFPQQSASQSVNPHEGDPTAIRAGRGLYGNRCAMCHGPDARGLEAPDLVGLWVSGMDDGDVFEVLRSGVPGSVMPSSSAPDDEIWAVVAYLKSLGTVPRWNTEAGNPARGREIFAATCAQCHRVNGVGGRLGPDLSQLAESRSREAAISAIRDPGVSVDAEYRSVSLEPRAGGGPIRGIVKNEDSFSIQIMDTQERLQGFLKADVEVVEDQGSLMPVFGPDRLTDPDLTHVLAYLATLAESDSDTRQARSRND
jgi:putative heme-binding domain-containing protein